MTPKILFILKRKKGYDAINDSHMEMSTGLFNSASFINDMLNECGIKSNIKVVIDNNDIDREVTKYKPTHVIIEALWVVPTKFFVLQKLHPDVKWIVRLHSEIPFLSNEGIALDWVGDYVLYENVYVSVNSPRARKTIGEFIQCKTDWSDHKIAEKIVYLPNFYPQEYKTKEFDKEKDTIDISCFGAIRPMKNHVIQALSAIEFANQIGKKLRFHINSGRIEQRGESVQRNLEAIFEHISDSGHLLINHEWCPRDKFLEICSKMDIGMQVSFSETFNIVSADSTSQGVPIVTSNEIPWGSKIFTANPNDINNIVKKLKLTYCLPNLNNKINRYLLKKYTNKSRKIWLKYFTKNKD
jgi:hypothetical protein